MVRIARTAACLVALAGRTAALRAKFAGTPETNSTNATLETISTSAAGRPNSTEAAGRPNSTNATGRLAEASEPQSLFSEPFRQEMQNHWDLQYTAPLVVGGQTLQGILDTGSFELLVFSKTCSGCGKAAKYDEHTSKDLKRGGRQKEHSYGSGTCYAVDAQDKVQIGSAIATHQDMWISNRCEMPVLTTASFEAVVGIGPPGHLARAAQNRMETARKTEEEYKLDGMEPPAPVKDLIREAERDIAEAGKTLELLVHLGVKRLSACYGREVGSPGWLTWNDRERADQPGVTRVPVAGVLTWGVKMGRVGLVGPDGRESAMSCQDGCGAIIDTGTSLIGVPSIIYNRITEVLSPGDGDPDLIDCRNMDKLPRLMLTLGGQPLYLHPSTYIGNMAGGFREDTAGFMRSPKEGPSATRCSLLLTDMGSRGSQFGPLFILGIPFMREYYTTFDLGTGLDDRSIFVSPASPDCTLEEPNVEASRVRRSRLTVDASKIRVPDWLTHDTTQNITI